MSGAGGPVWDWRDGAECRGADPDMFTAEGETGPLVDAAKKVCAGCPVAVSCLHWALSRREPEGVWAGMTVKERVKFLRTTDVPRVATVNISDLAEEIALADRIGDAQAQGRGTVWTIPGVDFGMGKDATANWFARFNTRLNGGMNEHLGDTLRSA
ncbi:WhiB family transcriptional regulator [Glutamicibacter sp. V16R2B1]|uniref:WhiB family transcriptional regulator n=1 Tax=Glutamicibacter sp. V16R2B1 TaxID=2036207 RepID=UPI0010FCE2E2|nr:WhiB family transcriptional regulator [Glutamicibacter sp. V16R2B1]TLK47403.1 WhiB family transcriptional regulator [Glutamicibacter sp. V16R2B1]